MSRSLQAVVQRRDDVTFCELSGVIDEDNELATVADGLRDPTAVIKLAGIERINSCGVRDWVQFLDRLRRAGTHVVLVECSRAMVSQINLVDNFVGGAVVQSFHAPYFCVECEVEKLLVCDVSEAAEMGPPAYRPPICRCDDCDQVMEFDDLPASYFAFLRDQSHLAPARRAADTTLDESSQVSGGQLSRPTSTSSLPSVPSLPSALLPSALRATSEDADRITPVEKRRSTQPDPFPAGAAAAVEQDGSAAPPAPAPTTNSRGFPAYLVVGVLLAAAAALALLLR